MRLLLGLTLLGATLLLAVPAHAQIPTATLTGTVVDSTSGTPLPGANVFIAGSMIGTTTDREGRYRLERVPLGAHRLYVSMVGFEPRFRDLNLREARIYPIDFALPEAIIELDEVTVEAKGDKNWKRRLERFMKLFIGETPNAAETKIVNPEVLDFRETLGHLEAYAAEPLIIENRALGYRIHYFLKEFVGEPTRTRYDGEPLFEEMTPRDAEEAARWEQKRREAFMGSFRHFMLALLAGRTEKQGFQVYSRPTMGEQQRAVPAGGGSLLRGRERFPVDPATLLKPGEIPSEKILDVQGFLEIIFMGEKEDPAYLEWSRQPGLGRKPGFQTSWINLERGPVVVDYKGDVVDPYGVTFYGYWAFERVADEVPKEYRPGR
ncbi:MAG: hypothetical protein KatS3mg042_1279 [Rhodothermaceae bacterium]|nr:MAG: hypothetical protein KatS3mg042_1279 [Rhodothermaceae bacterium]